MNNLEFKGEYRRNLPHIQPPGATFFITARLAGSLPPSVLQRLSQQAARLGAKGSVPAEGETASDQRERERFWFREYETLLHETKSGPHWLADDRVAAVLAESMHYQDGKQYRLDAFCIMPNHLHIVLMPRPREEIPPGVNLCQDGQGNAGYLERMPDGSRCLVKVEYYSLAAIMHRIKRRSAREGNKLLNREGEFWEHESYDHYIRDDDEWQRTVAYVLNNPVKAGLVRHWKDWKWNYVRDATQDSKEKRQKMVPFARDVTKMKSK
jgi:REP element-mobilizing transposase RayT